MKKHLLLLVFAFAATVLTVVIILWLSDRYFFDSNDNFNPSGSLS